MRVLKSTVAECRRQIADLQAASVRKEWHCSTTASLDDFPSLSKATGTTSHPPSVRAEQQANTNHVEPNTQPKKPRKKPVIGASVQKQHVKSVATRRTVDVFVSRLRPLTSDKELIECAKETAASCDIKVVDLACTQLKSTYEHLYSSFHVAVCVEAQQFKAAVDEFMSAEAWPSGILVKRFFKPKNGSAPS